MRSLSWLALACCLLFVVQGLAFIPRLGVQYDEALFTRGIYPPIMVQYKLEPPGLPLMLMTYIGALKIWLYQAILSGFDPSPCSLRLPVLLIGALAIWLFFVFLRVCLDARAAVIGCCLLATDSMYLLTTCFDWGPVALEHLLLLVGLLAGVQTYRSQSPVWAGAAGLSFGLALWDKAIFLWVLAGLLVAVGIVFPQEALRTLRNRRIAASGAIAFLAGAAPFLLYNLVSGGGTFASTARFSLTGMAEKLKVFGYALDGSALFDYLVRSDPTGSLLASVSGLGKVPVFISELFGRPQSSLQIWAVLVAVLSIPLLRDQRARRVALFALVAGLVALLLMLTTEKGGESVHHYIIFWPLPQVLLAVALVETAARWGRWERPVRIGLVAVLCFSNLLVANQYLKQLVAYGPPPNWSDAIFPLSRRLGSIHPRSVFVVDWGIYEPLRFLNGGRLPLVPASGALMAGKLYDDDRLTSSLASQQTVFVSYTDGNESFPGVNKALQEFALRSHYQKKPLEVILDNKRRPIFEVFGFRRTEPPELSRSVRGGGSR